MHLQTLGEFGAEETRTKGFMSLPHTQVLKQSSHLELRVRMQWGPLDAPALEDLGPSKVLTVSDLWVCLPGSPWKPLECAQPKPKACTSTALEGMWSPLPQLSLT